MALPGLRYIDNRTMGFKLTAAFLSVILLPMLLLAYISYRLMDERLLKEAKEKIGMGMRAAWTEYYIRGDQMRYGMLQAASMEEIKRAIRLRDKAYLRKTMMTWKHMRPYVDIWAVVDENGKVIARLNSDDSGDRLDLGGALTGAVSSGEPTISTEILDRNMKAMDGSALKEMTRMPGSGLPKRDTGRPGMAGTPGAAGRQGKDNDIMALTVVTPVLGENRRPMGAIVTANVLNNDGSIPDAIAYKFPGLFTAISINGVRVSTNLSDGKGSSLNGTVLPADVRSALSSGSYLFKESNLPGMTYMAAFEPIRNYEGGIIGSIDVGMSKESLWAIQKENQRLIAVITLFGLAVSFMVALLSTRRITRPIKSLKKRIDDFAGGDLEAMVEIDSDTPTKDEIKTLARTFNSMMDEVRGREKEKEHYLREIEERSRRLAGLNDELKKANEEIEVAYEETQSQTEELHAVNEELRLLNEDLDRKNLELLQANRTIIKEEDEIKKTNDKLRLIYDSIRDYVLLVDYDCRIIEANRCFTEKFRIEEPFVAGRQVYTFFGFDGVIKNCPIRKSIDTMRPAELELVTSDGRMLRLQSYPLLEERRGPGKAVVYIQDVTERRLLMQKLAQSDKLSSLGELVSGVAHELNNPLTGIMCFSELLIGAGLDESVNVKLRKINDASHRCKKIIDNLLTFARWKKPERKSGDVNKIVKDSIELRAYQLNVDGIRVELDLDDAIPHTMVDESQLQQVFLNLINNSRDAIIAKGEKGVIKIRSSFSDSRLTIRFEDSGAGIPEGLADKIFDPFFTTKDVGKGTGLGLSISYGIIREHGGNIYASGNPGGGAVFVVELPVVEGPGQEISDNLGEQAKTDKIEAATRAVRPAGHAKGRSALVVDDEAIVLDLLCETLSDIGFNTDKAGSGAEALEKFKIKKYDLIITDIKMPGMDGKEFYDAVGNISPGALNNIIFITGDIISKGTRAFVNGTGNLYIKKPFTVEGLKEVVYRFLSNACRQE